VRRSARPLLLLAVPAIVVPLALSSQAATAGASYKPYAVGFRSGEPSIGFDPRTNTAMYTSDTNSVRMSWDAQGRLTTKNVPAFSSQLSLDPIGWTDQLTHRTFVSQLIGACSLMSYSDDAGATWHQTQGCGADVLLDHQTVGGGPYRRENTPASAGLTGYPDAVYYCAQNSYSGTCARSDDGGLTFLAGTPAYNVATPENGPEGGACSAIHGHLRVAPDGVVYLPNKGCGGTPTAGNLTNSEFFGGAPAVSVSEDNGLTWTVRPVPGAHNPDESDPSVASDRASTTYFGWEDGTNPSETTYGRTSSARISVTKDHGKTWTKPYDVSSALGLRNVQFPEVIAGDPGRAAFAFLGTKGVGDDQHNGFVGEWHLYVATTIDGGKSWRTVDTTPHDPVQRGCISLQGTSNKTIADKNICSQRNLLDFNDITLDRQGRVLVAYADGCVEACVTDPTSKSKGAVDMVMRQTSGPLLYVKGSYSRS
jgi:YD repeat-containing protein